MEMEPANTIIHRLGGPLAVARELGLDKTTVYKWMYPKPQGRNGNIPLNYVPPLLAMSDKLNAGITFWDFQPVDQEDQPKREV